MTGHSVAGVPQLPHRGVCSGPRWRCFVQVRTDAAGHIKPFATPSGFGPADLADAYKLDTSINPRATIAVVDAYDYANADIDLAAYRSQFGLPPCTVASGCLTIVNQNGLSSPLPRKPPKADDWTVEAALDLDMASAACPDCKLVLVEADDDRGDGLFVAQNAAAQLAAVVSNSWGGPESSITNLSTFEQDFDHPGIAVFAAAGDSGFDDGGQGPQYPSTSAFVTGVGGTTLVRSTSARGWSETAWNLGGSSCSGVIAKPSFQTDSACANRAAADVAAVGDTNPGLAIFNKQNGGWLVVGGTSAATPLVAGIYLLTDHGTQGPSFPYANTGDFFDVTSGSNGSCGNVLCNAGAGWDGPTGIGTPNGAALRGCVSQCSGKDCGDDGCGFSCGSCAAGSTCSASGVCVTGAPDAAPPPPDAAPPPPDAAPRSPDAAPPPPDAAPRSPDAAPPPPDAAPGSPDAAPRSPDAAPGSPDAAPRSPDAGAGMSPDAGQSGPDAGAGMGPDAGQSGPDGGSGAAADAGGAGGGSASGGCGCVVSQRSGRSPAPGAGLLVLVAAGALLLFRRRLPRQIPEADRG